MQRKKKWRSHKEWNNVSICTTNEKMCYDNDVKSLQKKKLERVYVVQNPEILPSRGLLVRI